MNAMLSWQVGRVKITRIVEMDLPVPIAFVPRATSAELRKSAWLYPQFVTEDDTLKLSVHALLVEAPGLNVIVDTCVGNDRPREITGDRPLATPFLQYLGEAGWSRDGVDVVVCTHLHVDHVGWNTMLENGKWLPTFPRARYLIGRVITGDMVHHPCQIAHPDWALGVNEPEAAARTRSRLFAEWADQEILVIGSHFTAPTAGYVVRDGAAFRFAV